MKSSVVVIGGGVIGLATAHELQHAGQKVTLIDRAPVGTGCSYGNAGWVTPCFAMPLSQPGMLLKSVRWLLDSSSPLHIQPSLNPVLMHWLWRFLRAMNRPQMLRSIEVLTALSRYSLDVYADLGLRHPDLRFEKKGLLMVSATEAGVAAARAEMNLMTERGIPARPLTRDEALAFEPTLRPLIRGAVYFPDEAQLEPFLASQALAREFEAAGGKIVSPAEASDFEVDKQRITRVITSHGPIEADLVILATGSWSPSLAKKLRVRVPILGGKGYSMTLEGITAKPKTPIMIVDRKVAVTPFSDRVRIAGTLELVDQDFSISSSRLKGIYQGAHEYLDLGVTSEPGRIQARDIWCGLRPCTPDGVPMIGFSRKVSNLFYNTGHQMLGLQTAPGSARLAADLILGRTPITQTEPFRPERYE